MKNIIFQGIDNLVIDDNLEKDSPKISCMGICLNSGCMYDCKYCYAKGNTPYTIEEQLMFEDYQRIIDEAAKIGCKTVIITGVSSPSEPLLSKKIKDIINIIASYNMYTIIYTNAYVLGKESLCQSVHNCSTEEFISFLNEKNVSLMISCDSFEEEDYNHIVQCNGAFSIFKQAIANLIDGGFTGKKNEEKNCIYTRVAVSSVISKKNIDYLDKMSEIVHSYNWQFICKFPSLTGNAVKYKEFFFTPEEVNELRPTSSDLYTDKKETLVIQSENGKKYCLANQLGIAINGKGQPLTCLSGDIFLEPEITVKEYTLSELIIIKKNLFGLKSGDCPKKKKYYEEKKDENI